MPARSSASVFVVVLSSAFSLLSMLVRIMLLPFHVARDTRCPDSTTMANAMMTLGEIQLLPNPDGQASVARCPTPARWHPSPLEEQQTFPSWAELSASFWEEEASSWAVQEVREVVEEEGEEQQRRGPALNNSPLVHVYDW